MSTKGTALFKSPGKGGKGRIRPRGRQLQSADRSALADILGADGLTRDRLIEYLHQIQDQHGQIRKGLLHALAERMNLPMAEVFEVADFYHNFDVVEDDAPQAKPVVHVCDSLSCVMAGADQLADDLAGRLGTRAEVRRAACLGRCDGAPATRVGWNYETGGDPAAIESLIGQTEMGLLPSVEGLDAYRRDGGYALLQELHRGERQVDDVLATLNDAGLRGLGGAGFPTGRKWQFVRAEPGPRLMAVNGDESEPGTFKDRHFLLTRPHRLLEGALIAAHVIEADKLYIYIRDEYPDVRRVLADRIAELPELGLRLPEIEIRRGAGAYICGEESAMLESLEGKRGLPRHKPPFPAQVGLFGRPTLINNVETLYWVPEILARGADWFAGQGVNGGQGIRAFSVSGRVKRPGVVVAPGGTTARQLIDEYCGGMADGHELRAYLPGGASGGMLPADLADLPLDFGTLDDYGCFVGSHALIVLSDQDEPAVAAQNLMAFFAKESCGQCTPCRVGCQKALQLMEAPDWDTALLAELSDVMTDASICGLGQAAPNGLRSVMQHFLGDQAGETSK